MQRREFLAATAIGTVGLGAAELSFAAQSPADMSDESPIGTTRASNRKILIAGGGFNRAFIKYMAALSGKKRARICYLPTASADSQEAIIAFYTECATLDVEPHVQISFIESLSQKQ